MIFIRKNISGNQYKRLIDYCLMQSDAFMFVFCNYDKIADYKETKCSFQEQLKPFLIKTRHNPLWPSTELTSCPANVDVCVYRTAPAVKEFLNTVDSVFDWDYPNRPEDLSFFYHNECWFGSSAHEKYMFMKDSRQNRKFLTSICMDFRIIENQSASLFYEAY